MIVLRYQGRSGNQMFQYVFARQLATKLGYRLEAQRLAWFDRTKELIDGRVVEEPSVYVRDDLHHAPNVLMSWEEMVSAWTGKRVVLESHFEQSRFYLPIKEEIRSLYQLIPPTPHSQAVIHIRGTDCRIPTEQELDYYKQALDLVDRNCVVVTDDPEWSFVKDFNLPVRSTSSWSDFRFIAGARQIIIGRSTFGWWGAFLSNATLVIQPEPTCGARSLSENPAYYLGNPDWLRLNVPLGWPW